MCVMKDTGRTVRNVKPSRPIVAFRADLNGRYTGRTYNRDQIYHDERAPQSLSLRGEGGFYAYSNPKACPQKSPERVLLWGRVISGVKRYARGRVHRAEYMMYTANKKV